MSAQLRCLVCGRDFLDVDRYLHPAHACAVVRSSGARIAAVEPRARRTPLRVVPAVAHTTTEGLPR
jgi:hypothetical protein